MREYGYVIRPVDTDINAAAPPSHILRLCVDATRLMGEDDGVPAERVMALAGGVWMIARLSLEQRREIRAGEELVMRVGSLGVDGSVYIRDIDIKSGGGAAGRAQLCYIVVSPEERRILRHGALERLWTSCGPPAPARSIGKIRVPEDMRELCRERVRFSECDMNGHFSGPNYADLICDAAGFWKNGPNVMRSLQIDYNAEFLPGETVTIQTGAMEDFTVIRGLHESGSPGFKALCRFDKIL